MKTQKTIRFEHKGTTITVDYCTDSYVSVSGHTIQTWVVRRVIDGQKTIAEKFGDQYGADLFWGHQIKTLDKNGIQYTITEVE